ncbi:hypothetical protein CMK20_11600 [Candidatus Poribacteria bacterium]|nr:hypothetical protein [Candidatus Poribacteria bacterium]
MYFIDLMFSNKIEQYSFFNIYEISGQKKYLAQGVQSKLGISTCNQKTLLSEWRLTEAIII